VQTQDLSTPGRVAVQARAEFDPGVAAGRHTHPGEELGCLLEGQLELRIDGQPPRIVKAGEAFFVPAGLVHDGINTGSGKAKVLATYIVEKGKPVATPAN
jgi:quercetin dioxygenase-like cupin family protein